MACDRRQKKAAQTAAANGIPERSSRNGNVAGSTNPVSPFLPPPKQKQAGKRRGPKKKSATPKKVTTAKKRSTGAKKKPAATTRKATTAKTKSTTARQPAPQTGQNKAGQASFFAMQAKTGDAGPWPTQHQIKISNEFSPEELQTISVHLGLGAAAVTRHIHELKSGARRGIGHADPRLLDWAKLDRKNFQFLANQVAGARRDGGYLDTSALKAAELFDLWEFSKFETDRAQRNIDHLFSGDSHLKGPTAQYLAGRHRLDARFYTFLAHQLEPMITPEMVEKYYIGL